MTHPETPVTPDEKDFAGEVMSPVTYRVRVAGTVSAAEVEAELEDHPELLVGGEQHRTVLVGRFADSDALTRVLDDLREVGIEIRDVRRLPTWYELTVDDEPTDGLQEMTGDHDVEVMEFYTLLRVSAPVDLTMDDVTDWLEAVGFKVGSIRRLEGPVEIPNPRAAHDSEQPAGASR